MLFFSHQQTTVEEQSRIMQLETELSLRRAEVEKLQAQLRRSDADSEAAAGSDTKPETFLKEGGQFKENQQEVESLKVLLDNKNQEISDMKQKLQQAAKENMETMDSWKVFCCCARLVTRRRRSESFSRVTESSVITDDRLINSYIQKYSVRINRWQ